MCGIVGAYGDEDKDLLSRMLRCVVHRGPDSEGSYFESDFMMGMRRLSIIDISDGDQPISNESGGIQVVFNGEIYNYRELRQDLQEKGHSFSTDVDTEVIPHLYEEYGEKFVTQLDGMFAIAVWDSNEESLFLYRDHLGIKPLYYLPVGETVYFASELQSLFETGIDRVPDPVGLSLYWQLDYIPAPHTAFENIKKMKPGQYLKVTQDGIQKQTYWDLSNVAVTTQSDGTPHPESFYVSKVRELLERSVKRRMIADVPVGAFLSGGLDSSAIVSLMSKFNEGQLHTFSIGFENADYDERKHSRFVADHFGTKHTEHTMSLDDASLVPEILGSFAEPLADAAAIPTQILAEKASKQVKVVNTGSGADEVFNGYERYPVYNKYWNLAQPIPDYLKRISGSASRFPAADTAIHRYLKYLGSTTSQRDAFICTLLSESDDLLASDDQADLTALVDTQFNENEEYLQNMTRFDIAVWLPGDLLTKVDRTTMAHSLEARTPFLNRDLVEFAMSIPPQMRIKNDEQKHILKRAVEDILPERILKRKKDAFNVPIAGWMRDKDSPLVDRFERACIEQIPFFDTTTVRDTYKQFKSGDDSQTRKMWKVLNLQIWHENYIQNDPKRSS